MRANFGDGDRNCIIHHSDDLDDLPMTKKKNYKSSKTMDAVPKIFELYRNAAEAGAKCPTYRELSESAGCTPDEAISATVFLRDCGDIKVESNCGHRRVFVVSVGAFTTFSGRGTKVITSKPIANNAQMISRKCLCCRKTFKSHGSGNHICYECKRNGLLNDGLGQEWTYL